MTRFYFRKFDCVWSVLIISDDKTSHQLFLDDLSRISLDVEQGLVKIYYDLPGFEFIRLSFDVKSNLARTIEMFRNLGIEID